MKAIAFDLGKVIFDFDYNIALDKIKDKVNVSKDKIIEEIFFNNFGLEFEKGLQSSNEFYLEFKNKFSASLNYNEFAGAWSNIFSPKIEIIEVIKKLNMRYPLYLISNTNELHFGYLYSEYRKVFSMFDELILSFKVKSVKPDIKIFSILKEMSGIEFKDIIYIDDRQDLISAAKDIGLISIQFKDYDQLIEDFKKNKIFV